VYVQASSGAVARKRVHYKILNTVKEGSIPFDPYSSSIILILKFVFFFEKKTPEKPEQNDWKYFLREEQND
jgi:hypothetical protein